MMAITLKGLQPERPAGRAEVPCGDCHLCCKMWTPLTEEEYASYEWGWVHHAGQTRRALKRKPNGDCVYLGDSGCTIHEKAPKICREFDCRWLYRNSNRAGRREAAKAGTVSKPIWERGRELVEMENATDTRTVVDHGPLGDGLRLADDGRPGHGVGLSRAGLFRTPSGRITWK